MKFSIQVLIMLLFIISITYAESYQTEYYDKGIVVTLSTPEVALRTNITSSDFPFELLWNSGKFRAVNSDGTTPRLSTKLVVPISGVKSVNLNVIKKRYLGYEYGDKHLGSLKPSIKLGETIKQRDRNISQILVNPFGIDSKGSVYIADELELTITFFERVEQSDPNNIIPSLRDVLNDYHLNSLTQSPATKKSHPKLLNADWYSTEKEYVKIETTKDGIAIISSDDIISSNSSFAGVNSKNLSLIYKGNEIPCIILRDNDGLLNSGDEIIFLGSRAVGEDTYHSVYTDKETFWLTFDESKAGLRYSEFPAGNPNDLISDIRVEHHYEEDNLYAVGDGFYDNLSRKVKGEGWYMFEINDTDRSVFNYNFLASPRNSSEINLSVRVKVNSLVLSTTSSPNNQLLSASINNEFVSDHSIPVRGEKIIDIDIDPQNIVGGRNNLKLFNGSDEFEGKYFIAPDYLELVSDEAPMAHKGVFDGETDLLERDRSIYIGGFSDQNVILIDKNNAYFSNSFAETGTAFRLGASPSSIVSLMINDSAYVDSLRYGVYTAVSQSPDYDILEIKYFDDIDAAASYIKSCPDKSQISLAANSDISNNSELVLYLTSLGSTLATNLSDRDMYVMSTIKGSSDLVEDINSEGAALLSVFVPHVGGQSFAVKAGLNSGEQYSFIANDRSTTERAVVSSDNKSNLLLDNTQATALYIYHPLFKEATRKLVDHRRSTTNMNIKMISVENIYKEFNYGIKSPHAIKSFLRYAIDNWEAPAPFYLTFVGDASWDPRHNLATTVNEDFVPAFGHPVSDFWYTSFTDLNHGGLQDTIVPEITIGRISCSDKEEADQYVTKAIDYDQFERRPWMKRFLFLSGGDSNEAFKHYSYGFADRVMFPDLCADTVVIDKTTPIVPSPVKAAQIINTINKGAVWISYVGHAAAEIFDMDGWQIDKLSNQNKYFFMTFVSCNSGAFANPSVECRNESYIFDNNRGAVAVFGSTNTSILGQSDAVVDHMFRLLADTSVRIRRAGDLLFAARNDVRYDYPNNEMIMFQYTLLGDALCEIQIADRPDLYTFRDNIRIENEKGESRISIEDSLLRISGTVFNGGFYHRGEFNLKLIHTYNDNQIESEMILSNVCIGEDFKFELYIKDMPGTHSFELTIDSDEVVDDARRSNNVIEFSIESFNNGFLALDPQDYWNINADNPVFRLVPNIREDAEVEYYFEILADDENETVLNSSANDEITVNENFTNWKPVYTFDHNESYFLTAKIKYIENGSESDILRIPFRAMKMEIGETAEWKQSTKSNLSENSLEDITFDESGLLKLERKPHTYHVMGASGDHTKEGYLRNLEILYEGNTISSTFSGTPVGMNLVHISGETGEVVKFVIYETWEKDSSGMFVNWYLLDSIPKNDYLILATCDKTLRSFYHSKYPDGTLDALRANLQIYGSELAKDIPNFSADPFSFVIFGRKGGNPGSAKEQMNLTGLQAVIDGELIISAASGTMTSVQIGPALKWNNLNIEANIPDSCNLITDIIGIDRNSNTQVLIEGTESVEIDLSEIDALTYPKIKYISKMTRGNDSLEPAIVSVGGSFRPVPEFAILKSNCSQEYLEVMRGDSNSVEVAFENISLRTDAVGVMLNADIMPNGGYLIDYMTEIESVLKDQHYSSHFDYNSETLADQNVVRISINKNDSVPELYSFNNSYDLGFNVYEDTEIPTLVIKSDGKEIRDSSNVSIQPIFEIELYDNSRMPVRSDAITVWINGNAQCDKSHSCTFSNYEKNIPLKAVLSFKSEIKLDYGVNLMKVEYEDARGNSDQLYYYLMVSQNGSIKNLKNAPNPVYDETSFMFDFIASDLEAKATIEVHSLAGRKVRTVTGNCTIGDNSIEWDGRDSDGRKLAVGTYFYMMTILSTSYVEPVFGKIMIVE